MHLIFNILTYYVSGDFVTYTPNKAPIAPKLPSPQLLPQSGSKLADIQWVFL